MSEYIRKTWVNGEQIVADDLNRMEAGIAESLKGGAAAAVQAVAPHANNKSNPHNVTAEQVGAAAKEHKHSATDINSGTLSVKRGGTGGATAAEARANLGAAAKSQGVTLTLAASAWTGSEAPYTATVTCNIAKASNNLIVGAGGTLTAEQQASFAAAMIVCTAQAAGSITLTAYGEVPTIDLPVNVLEVG